MPASQAEIAAAFGAEEDAPSGGASESEIAAAFGPETQQAQGGASSAEIAAAFGSDPVVARAPAGMQFGTPGASQLDQPLHVANPLHHTVERIVTGDIIRDVPKWMGVGSEQQQALSSMARTQGKPLAAHKGEWGPTKIASSGAQFGANVLAGAAGTLSAVPALAYTAGSVLARDLSEQAARLIVPHWLPKDLVEKPWFRKALEEGELSWDAHSQRMVRRHKEFWKSFVAGLNPAVTAVVTAPEGRRAEAFWEAMYTYPVESLLPAWHYVARPAMKVKGDPYTAEVNLHDAGVSKAALQQLKDSEVGKKIKEIGEITDEGVVRSEIFTMRPNKQLRLNRLGRWAFERTPDWAKSMVWDVEPPRISVPRRLMDMTIENTPFRDVNKARADTTMSMLDAELGAELAKIEEQVMRETGAPATAKQKMSLFTGELEGMTRTVDHLATDVHMQKAWADLHREMANHGITGDDASLIAANVLRSSIEVTHKRGKKMPYEEGGAFAQLLPEHALTPDAAIRHFSRRLEGEQGIANALRAEALRLSRDPNWIVYMDNAREAVGKKARWEPRRVTDDRMSSESRQQFMELWGEAQQIHADSITSGEAYPHMPITDWGSVHRTSSWKQWVGIAKDAKSKAAKARLLAMLAFEPAIRHQYAKDAPALTKMVSAFLNDPLSAASRYRQMLQQASIDSSRHLGIDPIHLAKQWDSYMSRMYKEMATNEAAIAEDLAGNFIERKLAARGARKVRQLSKSRSDDWLMSLARDGKLDVERVAASTAQSVAMLADQMRYFSELKDNLVKAGLASDTPRGGWERVATVREKNGASGDPYNFIFGKLAGTYIHPSVAKRLRLTRTAMRSGNSLLTMWKLLHTIYNPPGYPLRNHLGDWTNIIAATGVNPWLSPRHLKSLRAVEREVAYRSAEKGAPMTRDYAEALSIGAIQDALHVVDAQGGAPKALGQFHSSLEALLSLAEQNSRNIIEDLQTPSMLMLQLDSLGRVADNAASFARGVSPRALRQRAKKVNEAIQEVRRQWQELEAEGMGLDLGDKASHVWFLGTRKLQQFNNWLGNNALAQWNMKQENVRRLWLYKHAKHELGMTQSDAGAYVKSILHDYGDKPAWLENLQKGTVSGLLLPPFITYGYKQANFSMRRALNDPHLPIAAALVKGMVAYNQEAMAEEERSNRNFMAMHRLAANTAWGADRWLIGSNKRLANALADLGFGKEAVDGVAEGDLTMTMPLRDMFNLNTMLSDIRPSEDLMEMGSRAAPFVDVAFTLGHPHGESLAQRTIANPASTSASEVLNHKIAYLAKQFVPHHMWKQAVTAGKALDTAVTGTQHRTKQGTIISPLEVMRPFMPATPLSPIDQVNAVQRVHTAMRGELMDIGRDFGRYKNAFNIYDPEERILRTRGEIEYEFTRAEIQLVAARKLMGNKRVPVSRFVELRKARKKALKRFDAKHDVSTASLMLGKAGATVRAFQRSLESIGDENE